MSLLENIWKHFTVNLTFLLQSNARDSTGWEGKEWDKTVSKDARRAQAQNKRLKLYRIDFTMKQCKFGDLRIWSLNSATTLLRGNRQRGAFYRIPSRKWKPHTQPTLAIGIARDAVYVSRIWKWLAYWHLINTLLRYNFLSRSCPHCGLGDLFSN